MSEIHPRQQNNVRFYVVLITLVVAGIFVVLLLNDNGTGFGVTNFVVFQSDNSSSKDSEEPNSGSDSGSAGAKDAKYINPNNEVDFSLAFDKVPQVNKNARIEHLDIAFRDFSTKIYVNGDRLELNGLDEATLGISGFSGTIFFNPEGITLDGTARKLEVNGVTLSSQGTIKISFKGLTYRSLSTTEIELPGGIVFPQGNGELEVSDKLTYKLEQDQISMAYYNGRISIDEEGVKAEGVASGIKVSGALLKFDLS